MVGGVHSLNNGFFIPSLPKKDALTWRHVRMCSVCTARASPAKQMQMNLWGQGRWGHPGPTLTVMFLLSRRPRTICIYNHTHHTKPNQTKLNQTWSRHSHVPLLPPTLNHLGSDNITHSKSHPIPSFVWIRVQHQTIPKSWRMMMMIMIMVMMMMILKWINYKSRSEVPGSQWEEGSKNNPIFYQNHLYPVWQKKANATDHLDFGMLKQYLPYSLHIHYSREIVTSCVTP